MIKEYQTCTILWHFVAVFPLNSLLQAHWCHSAASSCCYTVTSRLLIGPATHFGADSLRWAVDECFQGQCQQNHTCIYTSIVKKICIQTFSSSSRFIWAIEAWNQIVKAHMHTLQALLFHPFLIWKTLGEIHSNERISTLGPKHVPSWWYQGYQLLRFDLFWVPPVSLHPKKPRASQKTPSHPPKSPGEVTELK